MTHELPKDTSEGGTFEWPKEVGSHLRQDCRRRAMPLQHYESLLPTKNAQLREAGSQPIIIEELIGARLYTGPIFYKYNTALRAVGFGDKCAYVGEVFKKMCHGNKCARYTPRPRAKCIDHGRTRIPASIPAQVRDDHARDQLRHREARQADRRDHRLPRHLRIQVAAAILEAE